MTSPTLPFGFAVITGRAHAGAMTVVFEGNLLGSYSWSDTDRQAQKMRLVQAGVDCPFCHTPLTTIEPIPEQGGRVVDYDVCNGAVLVAPFPPHVRPLHCEMCNVYFTDLACD